MCEENMSSTIFSYKQFVRATAGATVCIQSDRHLLSRCLTADADQLITQYALSDLCQQVQDDPTDEGSVVGLTTLFPLDTARTRLQVFDDEAATYVHSHDVILKILKDEGLHGLYRGWLPVVTSLCCSNFVYFYIYNGLKAYTGSEDENAHAVKDLLLAFIAGVSNVLITTPLWVANTRLKLQGIKKEKREDEDNGKPQATYTGTLDCLYQIFKKEGILALWSGTGPSLVLAANPAIHFMVYEFLKRHLQRYTQSQELSGALYFIIGAMAKFSATVSTYPLQLLQTKLRGGREKEVYQNKGTLAIIIYILRLHGISGLFQGLEAKLLQTVLMAALMFLTYEKITLFVFNLMGIKS